MIYAEPSCISHWQTCCCCPASPWAHGSRYTNAGSPSTQTIQSYPCWYHFGSGESCPSRQASREGSPSRPAAQPRIWRCPSTRKTRRSDRLDLEVQGDKAKNQRLKILHEIVENSQAFRVRRIGHVVDRANLGSLRWLAAGQAMRKGGGAQYTSKEIWSLPTRISNSCLPSLFLVGHFASSSLRAISLDPPTLFGLTTILQYLAVLHNALDLVDNQRAHEH